MFENNEPVEVAQTEIVGIRFKNAGKIYYFAPNGLVLLEGSNVIVETVRGIEFGFIAITNRMVSTSDIISPLKPILRAATEEDTKHHEQNVAAEEHAKKIWEEKIKTHELEMQLVDVEYTFDNAKLIFYFTADGRVDFRDLVKDLASVFHTRIELRQIGVRDVAKLIGGIGVCGRPFCCKTFLNDFAQVSIKMAKEQNLSLSSSKISGTCGRLMCCLRFEHDIYEREYATFPKVDSIIETPDGRAVVIEGNFLTGKVKATLVGDNSGAVKTFMGRDVKVVGYIKKKEVLDAELADLEKN
ncbi:MAG: stage 0 sporulation protein [Clostridiales bacterium GWF2_38_85]|nr:MAG: stage 0 sporulation protein [Clostridiales bacterium GWF2_38_85]